MGLLVAIGVALAAQTAPPPAPAAARPAPVLLERKFRAGDRLAFEVVGTLDGEQRLADPRSGVRLDTFLPFQEILRYRFSLDILDLKADGIAEARYRRPTMTITSGPDDEGEMRTTTERIGLDLRLTLSPINEMLKTAPWAAAPPAPARPGAGTARILSPAAIAQAAPPFVSEIYRLALFQGSLDSSLDFSPRLPYDEVRPGDTWRRTVGFSPQALAGKEGESAVQRLDYVFTYLGRQVEDGKPYERIQATLKLDTDAAGFINQQLGLKKEDSPIEAYPLKLDATIDWRLDPATLAIVRADARSEGEFSIRIRDVERPLIEARVKGRTTVRPVAPAPATAPARPATPARTPARR